MKRHAIAATGHRPQKLYGYNLHDSRWIELAKTMRRFLLDRIRKYGSIDCITGMALGVDQVFGLVALKLREQGHDVRVIAAYPCHGQNSKWKDDFWWRKIGDSADERVFVYDGPYNMSCMQERNIWMVDHADEVMAVWDKSPGGTANCVAYAQKAGKPVINIFPKPEAVPAKKAFPMR